ncbi:hypothetical protein [Natrinema halophilum]|uniref:Uncharacterized protein n=1 Tax=Natrinema halophilum TaxID=1699371 RepID=A0A7D5KKT4_9EURY|nr:hypothetical protein [Natrinema halophilum]QLG49338.1 hypothetical protein HYG82_10920 [Natrinema halophilum]
MGNEDKSKAAENADITRRQTLKRAGLTTVGAITGLGAAADSTRAAPASNVGSIDISDLDLGGTDRYTGGWGPHTESIDARYSLVPSQTPNIFQYAFKDIRPGIEYLGYSPSPTTHWFAFSLVSHTWRGDHRFDIGNPLSVQNGTKFKTESPSYVDVTIKPEYLYSGFIDRSTDPRWEEVVNGDDPISQYKEKAQNEISSGNGWDDVLASLSATLYEEVIGAIGSPVGLALAVFGALAKPDDCGMNRIGNNGFGWEWNWCANQNESRYGVPIQYQNAIVGFELPDWTSQEQVSVEVGASIRKRVNENFGDSKYNSATSIRWELDLPGDESEAQIADTQYR